MFTLLLKHEWKRSSGLLAVLSLAALGVGVLGGIVPGYLLTDVVMHSCEPENGFYPGIPTVQSVVIACVVIFSDKVSTVQDASLYGELEIIGAIPVISLEEPKKSKE